MPAAPTLTGRVISPTRRHGWAVGHDEVILRTRRRRRDVGARALRAGQVRSRCSTSWFADATRGFAVGAYGVVYATTDGGARVEPGAVRARSRCPAPRRSSPTADEIGGRTWTSARVPPERNRARPAGTALHRRRGGPPVPLRRRRDELARAAVALRRFLLRRPAARRRRGCWPSACAATCSAPTTAAPPGSQIQTGTDALLTAARASTRARSWSSAWRAPCS